MSGDETKVIPAGEMLLGKYRLEGLLGSGGFGHVYAARQINVERRVAVKLLRHRKLSDETAQQRFRREADALMALEHRNVVRIFDADWDPRIGAPVLIFEWIDGVSLLSILRDKGALTGKRTALLMAQVSAALELAHGHGIVHRDLKPANLMITGSEPDEVVKVIDFGMARLEEEPDGLKLTQPGVFVGTPPFASPEQLLGDKVDARTDLYSLGCLVFACLTARAPFVSTDHAELVLMHARAPRPPLPATDVSGAPLGPQWQALCNTLLGRAPTERPANAGLVTHRLLALAGLDMLGLDTSSTEIRSDVLGATTDAPPPLLFGDTQSEEAPIEGSVTGPMVPRPRATPALPVPSPARAPARMILAPIALLVIGASLAASFALRRQEQVEAPAPVPTPAPVIKARTVTLLELSSDPAGAEVWVEGAAIGATPLEVPWPTTTGTLTVTLKKPGYLDLSRAIPRSFGRITLRLEQQPAPVRAAPPPPPPARRGEPPPPAQPYPVW